MAPSGVTNELGRHLPGGDESGEELLCLPDRAALVGLAVEDEGRRRDLVDVVDGREPAERLAGAGDIAAHLPRSEPHTDIARAEERLLIGDRRADHGGLEPIGVADRPARHEAAVRIAGHGEPIRIGDACGHELIHRGELLGEVVLAPLRANAVRELAPVRVRPRRVQRKHHPAPRREHVTVEVAERKDVAGEALWPPMDIDEERRRASPLGRHEQPAL